MNHKTYWGFRPKSRTLTKIIPITIVTSLLFALVLARADDAQAQSRSEPNLPAVPFNYEDPDLPRHFLSRQITRMDNTPSSNPVTDEGATLGRVLFYDVNLSANNTTSCASCHAQEDAFADSRRLSIGFDGEQTARHSPGLSNARYYRNGNFFWDERADTLEQQVLMPIQDQIEMGMTLPALELKLQNTSYYPELFEDAFGDDEVTSERVSLAMAQFIRSMVSYESKYDEGVANNFNNFTRQERLGMNLFNGRARCDTCHETDIQVATRARNNGLDARTTDAGVGGITGNRRDDAEFKVPSLRNIELTAPYMHDGRFDTLMQVVNFYDDDVQNHPNLDRNLQGGRGGRGGREGARRLNLSRNQRAALVAFMETLTDESFVNDVKFSDPFDQ